MGRTKQGYNWKARQVVKTEIIQTKDAGVSSAVYKSV